MNENMLPIGTVLRSGTYRIEKQIGSGGFGNTYMVRHLGLDEVQAMKEFFMKDVNLRDGMEVTVSIPGKRPVFEAQRSKFKKEARRLWEIKNPHIVKVHDLFEENGTVYYIMDYIDGNSLSDIVKAEGPMSEGRAMDIFRQMLEALEVVHGKEPKMLHLDIKPANIMVDKKGNAFLLDFGSSKQIDLDGGLTTDGSGITLSKGFAPTELIDQNRSHIGPWTDLYELGATLYYLVTGQQPPSVSEIQEDGSSAFDFPASVSEKVRKLILWLMSAARSARPKSVVEVKDRLKPSAKAPGSEPKPNTPAPDSGSKNKNDLLFVLLFIIGLVAILLFFENNFPFSSDSDDKDSNNSIAIEQSDNTNVITEEPVKRTLTMSGAIGEYPITMNLEINGSEVTGSYYYDKYGPEHVMTLYGSLQGNNLKISEYDENSQYMGNFEGTLSQGMYYGDFKNIRGQDLTFRVVEQQ